MAALLEERLFAVVPSCCGGRLVVLAGFVVACRLRKLVGSHVLWLVWTFRELRVASFAARRLVS